MLRLRRLTPLHAVALGRGRAGRTLGVLLAIAGTLAACEAEEDKPPMCDESPGALYERRIAPLLADDQPKTCNQCHLAGVDLSKFVRDDACVGSRGASSPRSPRSDTDPLTGNGPTGPAAPAQMDRPHPAVAPPLRRETDT